MSKNFIMTPLPLSLLFGRDGSQQMIKIKSESIYHKGTELYVFNEFEAILLKGFSESMLDKDL